MQRRKVPRLLDIIEVDDPAQIRAIAEDPNIDRVFVRRPFLNGLDFRAEA